MNQMIRSEQSQTGLSSFLATDSMFKNAMEIGKALQQTGLVKQPQAGAVMVLMAATTGENLFSVLKNYQLVSGQLNRKAMSLLAILKMKGHRYEWIDDGTDGEKATIVIHDKDGTKTKPYTYTMQDAANAGVLKDDSAWKKTPANMLRARACSNAIGMYYPEIIMEVGGSYGDDDDGFQPNGLIDTEQNTEQDAKQNAEQNAEQNTEQQIGRQPELPANDAVGTTEDGGQVEQEAPSQHASTDASTSTESGNVTDDQLLQLIELSGKAGFDHATLDSQIKKGYGVDSREELSMEQAIDLIKRLNALIQKSGK